MTTQQVKSGEIAFAANEIEFLFHNLHVPEMNYEAFYYAMNGYTLLENEGYVNKDGVLTIIDYSLPSSAKRCYIIDIQNQILLYKSLVAHGRNTGEDYAYHFSNQPGSYKSSLGFFITGNTYHGQNGYSLILKGLDTSYNECAKSRAIVIHGANYVSEEFIEKYGRLGRSFGCPALPLESCQEMIDLIKNGTVIFSYFPDPEYFENSLIINGVAYREARIRNESISFSSNP